MRLLHSLVEFRITYIDLLKGAVGPNGAPHHQERALHVVFQELCFNINRWSAKRHFARGFYYLAAVKSLIWTRYFPWQAVTGKSRCHRCSFPIHISGVSKRSYLISWRMRGPTETYGYPILPTKTPGGEEPSIFRLLVRGFDLTLE